MRFNQLNIGKWQQFKDVQINFHERLTIITGANGSGKTTLLKILATHCQWDMYCSSVPDTDQSGNSSWKAVNTGTKPLLKKAKMPHQQIVFDTFINQFLKNKLSVGTIIYSNLEEREICIPEKISSPQYKVEVHSPMTVPCMFIPSHRLPYKYRGLETVPTDGITPDKAFHEVSKILKNTYLGNGIQFTQNYFMKQVLISWNLYGTGTDNIEPNPIILGYYTKFQDILKTVLPEELSFEKLIFKRGELLLQCSWGIFNFDSVSGGIASIIDIVWMIYTSSLFQKTTTVMIDEVENHLHPSMQRRILPTLLSVFDDMQFIVSTHSPLIVNSIKNSAVYALRFNNEKELFAQKLDLIGEAYTAAQILNNVLGVDVTIPIWAEEKLNAIIKKYLDQDLNETTISSITNELENEGLGSFVPEATYKCLRKKYDKN